MIKPALPTGGDQHPGVCYECGDIAYYEVRGSVGHRNYVCKTHLWNAPSEWVWHQKIR